MAAKFDVMAVGSAVAVEMNREAALLLAGLLDEQAKGPGLPPPLFALGEKVGRLVEPEVWFGPLPVKKVA